MTLYKVRMAHSERSNTMQVPTTGRRHLFQLPNGVTGPTKWRNLSDSAYSPELNELTKKDLDYFRSSNDFEVVRASPEKVVKPEIAVKVKEVKAKKVKKKRGDR